MLVVNHFEALAERGLDNVGLLPRRAPQAPGSEARQSMDLDDREVAMTGKKTSAKPGRPSRTLDEEIAAAAERLAALRNRKRDSERAERERNQKAIIALIKAEGLDEIHSDAWREAAPKLREVLVAISGKQQKSTGSDPSVDSAAAHEVTTD